MNNVHTRWFAAPIEQIRPWIEACWSAGDRDCFPRDVIRNWRRNPDGVDPGALIPGQTLIGHGPFQFRLREWDGRSWKVDIAGGGQGQGHAMTGWHGFELVPEGSGCRVTHTLHLESSLSARLRWAAIEAVHNWAVEALLDRLEHALATGSVPPVTDRPVPRLAAVGLWVARRQQSQRRKRAAQPVAS